MTLQQFRKLVRTEFGGDLRHMTPANVREFLDRVQPQVDGDWSPRGRIHLNETESSYEGIVRDFFRSVLEMPSDEAVIRLWLYALEMASANISEVEAEKLERLFQSFVLSDTDWYSVVCDRPRWTPGIIVPARRRVPWARPEWSPVVGAPLLAAGPSLAALTRGADGCYLATRSGAVQVPGFNVAVVDTTGAGDGFTAGMLSCLLQGGAVQELAAAELREIGRFSNAVGALTCTRKGAIPALPGREEVKALLTA